MKNKYSVYIPRPCHEDWQHMAPVDKGRFCQSCAKQVIDFSVMTDQEILNYISKAPGRLCGRFANDQLQRPLQPLKQEKKKTWWIAAMVPLMMVFGKAGAQKKINKQKPTENIIKLSQISGMLGEVVFISHNNQNADGENNSNGLDNPAINPKLTVRRQKGQDCFTIAGKIEDAKDNMPVPYAAINIKGTKTATLADALGNFTLKGSSLADQVTLSISDIGFVNTEVIVNIRDTEELQTKDIYEIRGQVIDVTGLPIPSALVKTDRGKQIVTTDEQGHFSLTLPNNNPQAILIVNAVGFEEKHVSVSMKDTNEITIQCMTLNRGLMEIVVTAGKTLYWDKPKRIDSIAATARKVFHTETFKIYPNPAQRGQLITVDAKSVGEYSIQLFDNSGKLLLAKEFDAVEGATQTSLTVPSTFVAGIYYMRLVDYKTKKQYTDKLAIM